jgi:hypothetical protein
MFYRRELPCLEVPDNSHFTIVNGTKKKPDGADTDAAVAAWIKRDMSASTILIQTINQEIIKTLIGCKTSA